MNSLRKRKLQKFAIALRQYVLFFFLMTFVITCCLLLFLNELADTTGVAMTEENIRYAAWITFVNIFFLSLLCTIIDGVRRKIMVDRPVRKIITASEKIMRGDFSAQIPLLKGIDSLGDYNIIISNFNKMAKELSGMETLRTDFIANVSHELKTPLAVIQNYGTLLQQPGLPEEKQLEYAKSITDASRRLASLITNILKLNKLENQQIYPSVKTYDLGEQLCECLLSFENVWEEKELDIDTDIEDGILVDSDGELLSLVWNNLFSNAIKFTDSHGKVSVSLKSEGEQVVVRISDTGCGITPEVGKHIFEKFYQGDTSHAMQGNGLGLALVKRVIDIVGGDISVSSEVGQGSTFIVKLRRKQSEESKKMSV